MMRIGKAAALGERSEDRILLAMKARIMARSMILLRSCS
jgi:hypothetical protein